MDTDDPQGSAGDGDGYGDVDAAAGESSQATLDASDIEAALRVFRTLAADPALKRHAATDPAVRALLDTARAAVAPTPEDAKQRRLHKKKARLDRDRAVLADSGIRHLRAVAAVGLPAAPVQLAIAPAPGSSGGGSVTGNPVPPRLGNRAANDDFVVRLEEAERAESERKSQALAAAAPVLPARIAGDDKSSESRGANDADASIDSGVPESGLGDAEHDGELDAELDAEVAAQRERLRSFLGAAGTEDPRAALPPPRRLHFKRSCHICGVLFDILHPFYDQMCLSCADLNFAKRYVIALRLIRMGATVVVTTRFPHDAAKRFASEPDAASFAGRVVVYGLDFRDIPMLHHFTAHLAARLPRLDAIINNAAQTVRKPPAFYEHLLETERAGASAGPPPDVAGIVRVVDSFRLADRYVFRTAAAIPAAATASVSATSPAVLPLAVIQPPPELADPADPEVEAFLATVGASSSSGSHADVATPAASAASSWTPSPAALSQVALVAGDAAPTSASAALHFPAGAYDRDGQQVDLRTVNSWKLELGQISTAELVECHAINAFAPWVLISELRPLMERTGSVRPMESNSTVLWDKNPVHEWDKRKYQPPPLDEIDGAMRVLDPLLRGVRGEEHLWGVFLKNYRPTRW
ncbi:hypothetical protein HK405_007021 [Cladochytrium tenue]|nr:hypothetical protein HK405_007021 [Cladochytrium tenue]